MEEGSPASVKRIGNLWGQLTGFPNLLAAAQTAAAGKKKRPDVAAFLLNLEPRLLELQRELLGGTYRPAGYFTFTIRDPKPRQISAAAFRDRVVHHALTRVIEPIFEQRFSPYSFACRKRFGVHKALAVARRAAAQYRYVLKCDVRKYFASIDHAILEDRLARTIKCRPTLQLASAIIAGSNPQEEVISYFPGDDLFTPFERRRGLPLGNQTSQFFANLYLDGLDQLITRQLRPGAYARYVDDFVLFADSKAELCQMSEAIVADLASVRLVMHPGKSRIYQCSEGLSFLGWRIFPTHTRLARANVIRFSRRMRGLQESWAAGKTDWTTIHQSVQAWIGHASFGDTQVLQARLLDRFAFVRGLPSAMAAGGLPPTMKRRTCAPRIATTTTLTTGTTISGFVVPGMWNRREPAPAGQRAVAGLGHGLTGRALPLPDGEPDVRSATAGGVEQVRASPPPW